MSSESKVALVTAASRGIGAACARELHRRGYRLALLARSTAVVELGRELGDAVVVRGSILEGDDLTRFVESALERYGRIDAVVNNSGHPEGGTLLEIPDERWSEVFEAYVLSVIRMARLVVPVMRAQGGGAIVSISGSDAFEPDARYPVASVVRASLASFTKLLSREVGRDGIRVNCVAPAVAYDFDPTNIRADLKAEIPLGRPARYEEVARIVAHLLSDEASFITGEHLKVDGGATRSV